MDIKDRERERERNKRERNKKVPRFFFHVSRVSGDITFIVSFPDKDDAPFTEFVFRGLYIHLR